MFPPACLVFLLGRPPPALPPFLSKTHLDRRMRTSFSLRLALSCVFSNWRRRLAWKWKERERERERERVFVRGKRRAAGRICPPRPASTSRITQPCTPSQRIGGLSGYASRWEHLSHAASSGALRRETTRFPPGPPPALSLLSSYLRHDRRIPGQPAEALDRHLGRLVVADDDLMWRGKEEG